MTKKPMHPNSLANLRPIKAGDPEGTARANHMREKGLETRRKNKEEREAMQAAVKAFQDLGVDHLPKAVDVLRISMAKAISDGDPDEITRLAALIAPYETPKLASQEVSQTVTYEGKTEEELLALAEELGVDISKEDLH